MFKPSGIITITTDFGYEDYFVGTLKGVILNINPDVEIIDISNSIKPGNIRHAAFVLYNCYKHYPLGTIHLCVVDPGVGSDRKPLLIQNDKYYFIVPDNGIVFPCIEDTDFQAFDISGFNFLNDDISVTFHGRDIFAPAAAEVSKGNLFFNDEVKLDSIAKFTFSEPIIYEDFIKGEVLHIDRFGNIITNIPVKNIISLSNPVIKVGDYEIDKYYEYYHQAQSDEIFLINGSAGFIEISQMESRACDRINVDIGDELILIGGTDD